MAGYHSFELCFLAAIYTNLLINKEPMDFFFSPKAGAWADNILRVAPDLLPKDSIRLSDVWINGASYSNFDSEALTITLPSEGDEMKVRCRISPVGVDFAAEVVSFVDGQAVLSLSGRLTANNIKYLQKELEKLHNVKSLSLDVSNLETITMTGLNCLVFFKQRIGDALVVTLHNPNPLVLQELTDAELMDEFSLV